MRLLVLSDVHANATALEAALAASANRWEQVICLGDVIGYGPDPNEVADRLRALAPAIIRGNHDRAATHPEEMEDFNPVARKAIEWTRDQLRPDNLSWLAQLPPGPLEAHGVILVHGAYQDEDQYVHSPAHALDSILASPQPITFFGHTHYQGGFSYRHERLDLIHMRPPADASFAALRLDAAARYLLNPGSIGQPRDGDPRAAFAIADLDHGIIEFWRVRYDIKSVQDRMARAGAPEALIERLAFGR